jgi:hypothetical protein
LQVSGPFAVIRRGYYSRGFAITNTSPLMRGTIILPFTARYYGYRKPTHCLIVYVKFYKLLNLTSSCLMEGSCLIYVCLRIVMSNTYCVVFLFCLSSFCVHNVDSFSGFSIPDCPFGFL